LLKGGHRVTVWNRTRGKCDSLVKQGAHPAKTVAEAINASELTLVCISDYATLASLILHPDASHSLAGKTLVQLTTGSPEEARTLADTVKARGADYLDGAIKAFPEQIGTEDAEILLSGSGQAYRNYKEVFKSLAPILTYLGEDAGMAAALDCAMLLFTYSTLVGFLQGAALCRAENVSIDDYTRAVTRRMSAYDGTFAAYAVAIEGKAYETRTATIDTWSDAHKQVVAVLKKAGLERWMMAPVQDLFQKAIASGRGQQSFAALLEILKGGSDGKIE
jgi:3-hydroxyisobutyrate dehydrogenase-like beta-hydroxyacid dehydrogenase